MEHASEQSSRRDFLQQSALASSAAVAFMLTQDTLAFAQASSTAERNSNMANLKGTKTEQNLLKAFAGESQARTRYTFFAAKAAEEGFHHVAAAFEETANQEKIHALQFFNYLEGGAVEITAKYPAGIILATEKNLEASAAGEREEWEILYPEFAKIAREEGFAAVAATFNAISNAEKQHEKRYLGFLKSLKDGTMFSRENVVWRCRNCGYTSSAPSAPGVCPACFQTRRCL